jgi:hypothetical protein
MAGVAAGAKALAAVAPAAPIANIANFFLVDFGRWSVLICGQDFRLMESNPPSRELTL